MIEDSVHHQAQVLVLERLDAVETSDRSRLGRLTLCSEDVPYVVLAEAALADTLPVQPEVRQDRWEMDKALPEAGQPRVILAIHAETEIVIQDVAFGDGRLPAVEARRRTDVATLLNQYPAVERDSRHPSLELPVPIHVIPSAMDHIRFRMAIREPLNRPERPRFQPVVRIQPHHPLSLRLAEALVDPVRHPLVWLLEKLCVRKARHHLRRVVLRSRVYHQVLQSHSFLRCNTLKALSDVASVIVAGGDDSEVHLE